MCKSESAVRKGSKTVNLRVSLGRHQMVYFFYNGDEVPSLAGVPARGIIRVYKKFRGRVYNIYIIKTGWGGFLRFIPSNQPLHTLVL